MLPPGAEHVVGVHHAGFQGCGAPLGLRVWRIVEVFHGDARAGAVAVVALEATTRRLRGSA